MAAELSFLELIGRADLIPESEALYRERHPERRDEAATGDRKPPQRTLRLVPDENPRLKI